MNPSGPRSELNERTVPEVFVKNRLARCLTLFILFVVYLGARPSWGFINIESVRQQEGGDFVGKSTLKFAGQSGNTDKLATAVSALNIIRGDRDEIMI